MADSRTARSWPTELPGVKQADRSRPGVHEARGAVLWGDGNYCAVPIVGSDMTSVGCFGQRSGSLALTVNSKAVDGRARDSRER